MKKVILKNKFMNFLKIIIFLVILTSLVNVCYRKYEECILQNEISILMKKSFENDSFNTDLKSSGDYKLVEKAVKNYLNDYSDKVQKILVTINDEKLKSILSAENYVNDGPNFVNTLNYLTTTKNNFNLEMNDIVNFTEKKSIFSYIESKNLSEYYQDLYGSYMIDSSLNSMINENTSKLKQTGTNINNLIDQEIAVINFLISNKDWTVKDNKIIFSKTEDLAMYNEMISKIY